MAKKKKPVQKKPIKKKPAKKTAKKVSKKTSKKVAKKIIKKSASKIQATEKKPSTKKVDYSTAVTPLGERLLVRAVEAETMTAGGIIIPDTVDAKSRYVKAVVLATGHGAKNKKGHIKPLDVKIGDTVLFPAHASVRIQFNSEELHIVNESDILGTV